MDSTTLDIGTVLCCIYHAVHKYQIGNIMVTTVCGYVLQPCWFYINLINIWYESNFIKKRSKRTIGKNQLCLLSSYGFAWFSGHCFSCFFVRDYGWGHGKWVQLSPQTLGSHDAFKLVCYKLKLCTGFKFQMCHWTTSVKSLLFDSFWNVCFHHIRMQPLVDNH